MSLVFRRHSIQARALRKSLMSTIRAADNVLYISCPKIVFNSTFACAFSCLRRIFRFHGNEYDHRTPTYWSSFALVFHVLVGINIKFEQFRETLQEETTLYIFLFNLETFLPEENTERTQTLSIFVGDVFLFSPQCFFRFIHISRQMTL